METTVRQTIKNIVAGHLKNGGVCLGQCLTAVGWVGGTLPELYEKDGMLELPLCDVAGGGIATGFALMGKRPIYVVRYQGFQFYNCITILNYAAKAKEMWGTPCPIFVRSIAMEGGIGPVASNSHHGLYMRMPGVRIVAPMTPEEYKEVWECFMVEDDPYYVSEHRKSFDIDYEMDLIISSDADITLLPISVTRLAAREAHKRLEDEFHIRTNVLDLFWLKPFIPPEYMWSCVSSSKYGGLVLDSDYANGVAKPLANDISLECGKPVHTLALKERTAGFASHLDNLPPTADEIVEKVLEIVK